MGTTVRRVEAGGDFGRDAFLSLPAEHAHYAMARGETVVQVHGLGPFAINYVK